MNFAHPAVLGSIAALVPLLALFFLWSWRTRRRLIREFVPQRLQATLTIGLSPRRALARASLLILTLAFLLTALARPRLGAASVEVKQRGLDIVIAVDTSRSMLAEDAGPGISRLQRARLAALDLARLAHRDRLGLVAFAGSAFLQCPLTIDDAAFRQSIDALDTGIIPQGGTALAPAIQTALGAFGTERDNVRVVVLFTDGEEHEPGAVEAARRAADRGLRVFTIGVGTTRGELIRVPGSQGSAAFLKDAQGNVVKSSLNEPLLREIATLTGGFYLPLQGPRVMDELFTRGLEPLPRADIDSKVLQQFHERFQWPLALALALLAWETLLPDRARTTGKARRIQTPHPALAGAVQSSPQPQSRTRTPTAAATLALILLAGLPLPGLPLTRGASASPGSALRHYRAGDFDAARQEYERLARSQPDDPRYRFNAGAAAYRAGDFTNAVDHFLSATRAHDLDLQRDGYYNLGNAQFRNGESATDPKQRQSAWEEAIRAYQNALNLDANHTPTRDNLAYVRQQLENLKNQEQNQQDSKGDQDQKDNQDQKPDKQSKPDSSKNEEKEKSDASQDSPQDSPPDPSQSNDPSQQQPQDQPESENEPKPEDSQDPGETQQPKPSGKEDKAGDQQKPQPQQGKPGEESPPQDAGDQAPAGQMTPKQALRLLDTTRGEEKMVPLEKRRARSRILKDW